MDEQLKEIITTAVVALVTYLIGLFQKRPSRGKK